MTETPPKPRRKCLICSVPVVAAHFGMDCCRACASFFKRRKLSGKKFACRAGDRKCLVVKDDKFMCRRCRFDRCIEVGMIYDGPLRVNKKGADLMENSPSSSDTASPSTSRGHESILERIGREYNSSVDRRRVQEERILGECEDRKLVPHPTQKIYLANYRTSVQTYNVCVAETLIFFREAFPSLLELSKQERDLLFKGYIAKFSMIESHYRTRKVWGEVKRYCMGSVLICVDLECTERWLGEEDGGENRLELLESIRSYSNDQFALVLPMLNKAQITSKEFYALLALVLCEIDSSSHIPDYVLAAVDEIRAEVFEDLQRYYKEEMGLSDFSTRLGNLMTLNHTIQECNSLFQEFFRMNTTIFDLNQSEDLIKELFS
ncbi:hypothetical protein PRIPAC_96929 [Pristionchus pacificus]|uniref:Nuclear receptor n=1 Tax=Pristionchus pacificus TaxID=54126 RepID=A0A2A6B315_PRIPA|nr:hypothetical protein PRIPAC_96929 [Pristionchus pacificus]|eukprot:PDM60262.1 nuclear receptor [Pristionchus pacificus]